MIITINTKEDSHEDIKRVIRMLQHLVGEHAVSNSPDLFSSSAPTVGENNLMSMFDSSASSAIPEEKPKEGRIEIVPY